ncbi:MULTISPECIES: sensor domain-containing diguanylate cyclase [Pseudoalteromonas]|uniref:sensor domain-containing diguanylate cyclase n=1 Tax=Pseudoalteromonas TaxID=53246 RepID=UPI000AC5CD8E|nr:MULTISPECIES: diguanylate cyclase [Pseudoalteromonas]
MYNASTGTIDSVKDIWHALQALPITIALFDQRTDSVFANPSAQTLLGIPALVTSAHDALSHLHLFETLDTSLPSSVKPPIHLENGQNINVRYSYIAQNLIALIFEVQHEPDNQADFDEVIAKISAQLIDIQTENLDQQIESALEAIGTFCHADRSYLFQFSNDGKEMSNTHEWVNNNINPFKDELQNIPQNSLPYFFKTMNEKHVFNVPNVSLLPVQAAAEREEFESEGIKSVLCIGLRSDNTLFGFIGCDCVSKAHNWTNTDLIRIKLVGEIIANALKNVVYKQRLEQTQHQLLIANQELKLQANIDSLTGIANRRCFDQTLTNEIQRATRTLQPVSLIICDIDYFKLYNDNNGHQKGDDVLRQVAQALQAQCKRQGDLATRYGGEEFAIILPSIDTQHCLQFADLLQQRIHELNIPHLYSDISPQLTLSIGCHTCFVSKDTTPQTMISAADKALYNAKNAGRNQVQQID